ncbi:calcium/sodium antiporter [Pararhodonellum marinum]|uniref:calcium/sodium antiporter n=1 Tax=Pararhodonellum marinum TaxID=2755358 RepID=UPI001890B35F|nr:calcium/sodium antiporter [Pararhodonellum marinum]
MVWSVLLLLLGFVLLVAGADKLVGAASALAGNFGIPPLVIGLTVVAFGTSAPELTVNVFASLGGASEMVLANVLGSNIFNVLGILGICALVYPLTVKSNTTWIEIPLSLLAAVLVWVLAADLLLNEGTANIISKGDGLVLLLFFGVFLVYNIMVSKNSSNEEVIAGGKTYTNKMALFWMLLGLAGLVLGGKLIVDNAVGLARQFGLSERVIGLTIVSIGTSLPELATSLVAVRQKKVDIAIGNVVGSNIFNIFFILGLSSTILPVQVADSNFLDIWVNVLAGLFLFVFLFSGKGRKLDRWEAGIFFSLYVVYLVYLLFYS